MWKQFSIQGNYKWIDTVPKLIDSYNNTCLSTIKMKPVEVGLKNQKIIFNYVYQNISLCSHNKFKFGDKVRISKIKDV